MQPAELGGFCIGAHEFTGLLVIPKASYASGEKTGWGGWWGITLPAEGCLGVHSLTALRTFRSKGLPKKYNFCLSVVGKSCLERTSILCLTFLFVMTCRVPISQDLSWSGLQGYQVWRA